MANKQNKILKNVKLPLKNDTFAYQLMKEDYKAPVVSESWDPEVASFFMKLYPTMINKGNNISDIQQRASFEALTKSSSVETIDDFLKIIEKLKPKK